MRSVSVFEWVKYFTSVLIGIALAITTYRLNRRNTRKSLSYQYTHGDVAVLDDSFKTNSK